MEEEGPKLIKFQPKNHMNQSDLAAHTLILDCIKNTPPTAAVSQFHQTLSSYLRLRAKTANF